MADMDRKPPQGNDGLHFLIAIEELVFVLNKRFVYGEDRIVDNDANELAGEGTETR